MLQKIFVAALAVASGVLADTACPCANSSSTSISASFLQIDRLRRRPRVNCECILGEATQPTTARGDLEQLGKADLRRMLAKRRSNNGELKSELARVTKA